MYQFNFRPTRPTSSHILIPTYPDSLSMSIAAATSGYRRFVRTVCTKVANVEHSFFVGGPTCRNCGAADWLFLRG
ncbi:hypothetical protein BDV38DRAFT_261091 [Aspergillus pseudotamarii]|uniref:Uncharacterized protein n=1 Tax=Aspergillus pseudotamarii TaxID=132259 RepID=A0A5N6SGG4_ASPPS|nr:uncharacterized protein BDV38DRAFT_261091 [Aspergillus pseudotamarii]KAE8132483.1 hypothetical protein BDV38DRAFT_261091 [Aspergillus pseudotamarii]